MGEQGRVCLIGFAGWKDRDPEHSTLLSHSITATGHIMRACAISSPQTSPSSHTHTVDYSVGSYQTPYLPCLCSLMPVSTHMQLFFLQISNSDFLQFSGESMIQTGATVSDNHFVLFCFVCFLTQLEYNLKNPDFTIQCVHRSLAALLDA